MKTFQKVSIIFLMFGFLAGFAGFAWAEDAAVEVAAVEKIDINTATAEQLTALKGIGPALAQRIVDYRQANGNFKTTGDLDQVKGIGPKILGDISEMITVGAAVPPPETTK